MRGTPSKRAERSLRSALFGFCALLMLRCFATALSGFRLFLSLLASPDLFRNFFDEAKLCKLLFFRQLIPDFAGGKAALRAQIQIAKRHILRSLIDATLDELLRLKFRALARDETQHHLLAARNLL